MACSQVFDSVCRELKEANNQIAVLVQRCRNEEKRRSGVEDQLETLVMDPNTKIEAFRGELVLFAQGSTSCSGEDIATYSHLKQVGRLRASMPEFMRFLDCLLTVTLRGRTRVSRTELETNRTQVEVTNALSGYISRDFQNAFRVGQSLYIFTMYRSTFLNTILRIDCPGGLGASGARTALKANEEQRLAVLNGFVRQYGDMNWIISYDQLGHYGTLTSSRAAVSQTRGTGIHTLYSAVVHFPKVFFEAWQLDFKYLDLPEQEWPTFASLKVGSVWEQYIQPSVVERRMLRDEAVGLLTHCLRYHATDPTAGGVLLGPARQRNGKAQPPIAADVEVDTVECRFCKGVNLAGVKSCKGCTAPSGLAFATDVPPGDEDEEPDGEIADTAVDRRPRQPRPNYTTDSLAVAHGPIERIETIILRVRKINPNSEVERMAAADAGAAEAGVRTFVEEAAVKREHVVLSMDQGAMPSRAARNSPKYRRLHFIMSYGHLENALHHVVMLLCSAHGNDEFLKLLNFLTPGSIAYMNSAKSWHKIYEHLLIAQSRGHGRGITREYLHAQGADLSAAEREDGELCLGFIERSQQSDAAYRSFSFLHCTSIFPALNLIRKGIRHDQLAIVLAGIKALLPLLAGRNGYNYGPWVVEYLLTWLVRAPEVMRKWHEATALWLGEPIDSRHEEMGRRVKRLLSTWDTESFENAIAFINCGGDLRELILREHGLDERPAGLRSETQLEDDIRIIETRLAQLRTYAVCPGYEHAETYDGLTRLLRGSDVLYGECEEKLRVWIGEWLEKADGIETVTWPSRLHVSQSEADLVAQHAANRAAAAAARQSKK